MPNNKTLSARITDHCMNIKQQLVNKVVFTCSSNLCVRSRQYIDYACQLVKSLPAILEFSGMESTFF